MNVFESGRGEATVHTGLIRSYFRYLFYRSILNLSRKGGKGSILPQQKYSHTRKSLAKLANETIDLKPDDHRTGITFCQAGCHLGGV